HGSGHEGEPGQGGSGRGPPGAREEDPRLSAARAAEEIRLANRSRLWLVLAGGAALVLVALALVAALLPRWVASPEFQAALSARASEALGTPVAWERLSIGLLPPRVVIESPALVGEKQDADGAASIRADAIDLRL